MRNLYCPKRFPTGWASNAFSPLHSPMIDKIDVVRTGRVRRAKLYYLRSKKGRAARIRERRLRNCKCGVNGRTRAAEYQAENQDTPCISGKLAW